VPQLRDQALETFRVLGVSVPVLCCLLPQLHDAVDVTLTRERGHVKRKARDSSHDGCKAVHVVGSQLDGEGQTIGERSLQWGRSGR
jgi:hypothetical protein